MFFVGLFVGAFIGVVTMCLFQINRTCDYEDEIQCLKEQHKKEE